eukprot:gene3442-3770_t
MISVTSFPRSALLLSKSSSRLSIRSRTFSLKSSSLRQNQSGFIPVPENALHVDREVFRPILVSIEGNIGAGKTTLLKRLREQHPEWIPIDEPVDTWSTIKNDNGESILEIFYKDRKRWSYTFQNCALLTRYQNIEAAVSKVKEQHRTGTFIFLTERCLETDYYVFTKMLRDEGSINNMEIELYHRLLEQLKKTATNLSAIIHVNTHPEQCLQRIRQRGRSGEEAITQDYLNLLHLYQDKWINQSPLPIFSTDVSNYEDVESFIKNLAN